MTKKIPLSQGKFALVDDEDYEELNRYKWYCRKSHRMYYAVREQIIDGKRYRYAMHRVILNASPGTMIDHANGNGLDNRRDNLRFCTVAQNARNSRKRIGTHSSPYKGVSLNRQGNGWVAYINYNGKINLGVHRTAYEAAQAYNEAGQELHGEFARLNDLSDGPQYWDKPLPVREKTSQYRGVCLVRPGKWVAYTKIAKKRHHLGYHETEVEAAKAFDKFCRQHNLLDRLNFPDQP